MLLYSLETHFLRGYIADPYWPERERLINVQKSSGLNRAKSDAARRKALEEYLRSTGMSVGDYEKLSTLASRPFYTDADGCIVIPELHVMSFLVATIDQARAAMRPCDPDQVRSRFVVSQWTTGKRQSDGVWSRFAVVAAGGGQKLSNQRGLRESKYIDNFTATGTIELDENFIKPAILEQAIRWGGQFVGIGASRKMGWGRFELRRFEPMTSKQQTEPKRASVAGRVTSPA